MGPGASGAAILEIPRSPADSAPILVCAGLSPPKDSAARALLKTLRCSAGGAGFAAGCKVVEAEASFTIAASDEA
jgi:hypothetical protein